MKEKVDLVWFFVLNELIDSLVSKAVYVPGNQHVINVCATTANVSWKTAVPIRALVLWPAVTTSRTYHQRYRQKTS